MTFERSVEGVEGVKPQVSGRRAEGRQQRDSRSKGPEAGAKVLRQKLARGGLTARRPV